jgi:hypothetical protein
VTRLAVVPVESGAERKPKRSEKRAVRRRSNMVRRMAQASSPLEQLAVAYDYFRSAITDHAVQPNVINEATSTTTSHLIAQAERLNPLPKEKR